MSKYITIKDMPLEERPREKLVKYGSEKLSNAELLALILRTGFQNKTALDLANNLLIACEGINCLAEYSVEELQGIKGIGVAKATQLKAVAELSKRLVNSKVNLIKVTSPHDVADILIPKLGYSHQEKFLVVVLDTKNQIIGLKEISKGSLNSSIVHPREVFRYAIKKSSASIILAHNHPSGDLTPSLEDINLSKRLCEVGKIVGIDVLDHLIIGKNEYTSLKSKKLF
ncbi:RadC family protein [Orenia marismortui]|uniref:DNA replication and repair protein RadC n=1 Tax=Orenia marismortui TaxID=46469 RepID=A0A4R8GSV7_9FIRM|nr:DNA repair protein RadC [Orenia marismortui]TDX49015.1 DNA replication and repair protein RadC [Orenia marismortui]